VTRNPFALLKQVRRLSLPTMVLAAGVLCVCAVTLAQQAQPTAADVATTDQPTATTAPAVPTPQEYYKGKFGGDLWVLAPPLVAILLAIMSRQVVVSLFVGVLVAAYMLLPCRGPEAAFADAPTVLRGVRVAVEEYLVGGIVDLDPDYGYYRVQIIVFTMAIGAMVGVVGAIGGTRAVVDAMSRWARTSRRAQLSGWVAGHAVFFDDYANTMILGPTLRPLFDRLRVSRAKLAYIVDSTAAPVASLVPIGTWIGAEVGYIKDGLDAANASALATGQAVPEIVANASAYHVFLASIGYRFYALFALALVALIALTRRDFGPMKKAEREAAQRSVYAMAQEDGGAPPGRAWYALLPVLLMVVVTVVILVLPGWQTLPQDATLSLDTVKDVLVGADPYRSILYGAVAGLALALLIALVARNAKFREAVDGGLESMSRMFPAIVILVLAWALSDATRALQLGEVVSDALKDAQFAPMFLPMTVFGAACLVSFATGSSWGTMGILCPATVMVAAKLCADMPAAEAAPLFYSAVGAVLAGSIFGDHCSPISDTTVLSSLATSCTLEQHVWTQMPYALLAAVVSVGAGNVLCNIYGKPWWMGVLAGVVALLLIVLILGRRAPAPQPPAMPPSPINAPGF